MTQLGLLGGTFDPPGKHHIDLALHACRELQLDSVALLVAGHPWMKQPMASKEDRLMMASQAVRGYPQLQVNGLELLSAKPTHTIETLMILHADNPQLELTFIMGSDAAQGMREWKMWKHCFDIARIAVYPRGDIPIPDFLKGLVTELPEPNIGDWSSCKLRQELLSGNRHPEDLLPAVSEYIELHHLYYAQ